MSILNTNEQMTDAQRIAKSIKDSAQSIFHNMTYTFNAGTNNFWNNSRATPSEIAEALGSDAKEIFELHYALGQFIGNIKPEAISNGLSKIGQFTMNEDGTVTILPAPSGAA